MSCVTSVCSGAAGELADLTMSTIVGANESRLNPVNETALNETASFAVPAPAPSAARESCAGAEGGGGPWEAVESSAICTDREGEGPPEWVDV